MPNKPEKKTKSANLPITTTKPTKRKINKPKFTPYDKKALALLKKNPTLTPYQIGKQLKASGQAISDTHIYRRLKKSSYLSAEFSQIEQAHMDHLTRVSYPLAQNRLDKALRSRDLDHNKAFPFVKLAYDKVHGETHKHVSQPVVNVENIERLQVVIGNDLKQALGDAQKETVNTSSE